MLNSYLMQATERGPNDQKQIDAEEITEFAANHRGAAVLGLDLSPIQDVFVPANLRFEIVDFCDPWSYSESTFDLIFLRGLDGTVVDWTRLYTEVYQALKPGAYIEHSEMCIELKSDDGPINPEHILGRWSETLFEASDAFGKPLGVAEHIKEQLEIVGFVDVVEQRFEWPIGEWREEKKLREIGKLNKTHWEQSIEGWCIALLTRALKFGADDRRRDEMKTMLTDLSMIVYGRRPESEPEFESEGSSDETEGLWF
ncbi:hypothetical protein GP486_004206 [Trichoglossum hirsutum]|uniref:Methyltransferase n=1 Tax=Trichoglossum hirsutum TaxID=265104 RepID=A0A9P8LBT2_9PEZI|nr:hypothetical protein GP486_004206 [Trichoglossum hirsutum]